MIIAAMRPAMGSLSMLAVPAFLSTEMTLPLREKRLAAGWPVAAPGCDGPRLQAIEKASRALRQNTARRGDDELSGRFIFGLLLQRLIHQLESVLGFF